VSGTGNLAFQALPKLSTWLLTTLLPKHVIETTLPCVLGDCNQDDAVNFLDIAPLIQILTGN